MMPMIPTNSLHMANSTIASNNNTGSQIASPNASQTSNSQNLLGKFYKINKFK